MDNGLIRSGNGRVKHLIEMGAERMKLFYRDGMFSLWEGGVPDQEVTSQILGRLAAFRDCKSAGLPDLLETAAKILLSKRYRNTMLLPYSEKFRAPLATVRDASLYAQAGIEREKALQFVKKMAILDGSLARWSDPSCWAGDAEATCYALQVLRSAGEDALFERGFRYLGSRFLGGMLYSTPDTCAFIELLSKMPQSPFPKAVVDGMEKSLTDVTVCRSIRAIDEMTVRIDSKEEVDYLEPRTAFRGELKVDRVTLAPGEKGVMEIIPSQKSIAPLARIYLPGNIAVVQSGASCQKLYLPIKDSTLRLEFYGIRKGRGRLRAVLNDMYDAERVGVLNDVTVGVT